LSVYNFVAGIIKCSSAPEEYIFGYFYWLSFIPNSLKLKRVALRHQYNGRSITLPDESRERVVENNSPVGLIYTLYVSYKFNGLFTTKN
jgi:hypothetical protein